MKQKFILILTLIFIVLTGVCTIFSRVRQESDINKYYLALQDYKKQNYKNAYKQFGKISLFSDIKAPALFRQARCATLIGDIGGAKRNYLFLLLVYPHSQFFVLSEYNLATILYNSNDSSAKRYFKHIIKYYPKTDYAIACEYYLGCMDMKSAFNSKFYPKQKYLKKQALKRFIKYIKLSPDGRFAKKSVENISKLGIALSKEDNLILANSCFKRECYNDATLYYEYSPFNKSWAKYALNEYKIGNFQKAKLITENGLKYSAAALNNQDIYDVIDYYISDYDNKVDIIDKLLNKFPKSFCSDYFLYLKAKNSSEVKKYETYEQFIQKYPKSVFAPEILYELFYRYISKKQYDKAIKLGHTHLSSFKQTDTSPAVLFWLGKIYERKSNLICAKFYYNKVISEYPDSYYSYRACLCLHKAKKIKHKNVKIKKPEFPCNDKREKTLASKLILLGDYDFILELYKDDEFVESWVEYQKHNYSYSVLLAEKAMKKIYPKPKFNDNRWKLVYPIKYWEYLSKYNKNIEPFMILSIIREESHFNSNITSPVGAVGLMQLMPATANELAAAYGYCNNLTEPENNIIIGSRYYDQLRASFNGEDVYSVMAYNSGRANVIKWLNSFDCFDIDDFVEQVPFLETKSYLKKVLRSYWCYSNIY